jgi:hypothetical protein
MSKPKCGTRKLKLDINVDASKPTKSLEDSIAMINKLAKAGISASQAGRKLKKLYEKLNEKPDKQLFIEAAKNIEKQKSLWGSAFYEVPKEYSKEVKTLGHSLDVPKSILADPKFDRLKDNTVVLKGTSKNLCSGIPANSDNISVSTYNLSLNGVDLGATTKGVTVKKSPTYKEVKDSIASSNSEIIQEWSATFDFKPVDKKALDVIFGKKKKLTWWQKLLRLIA